MPSPLLNLWACNQWLTESDRDAAVALADGGPTWEQEVDAIIQEVEADLDADGFYSSDPGSPYNADEWYADLTTDWPKIDPVIDPSLFISQSSQDAKDHWREHWSKKDDPNDQIWCFDYAAYQLLVAGHFTGGWKPDSTTYQVFREDTGVNMLEVAEGVRYVKGALASGIPVLVGIRLSTYSPRPNPDDTTNHFVVIVGMENRPADGAPTFLYWDNRGRASDGDAFILKPDLTIETEDGTRRAAQIRQTTTL